MAVRDVRLTAVFAIRDQLSPVLKVMGERFSAFKKVIESTDFKEFEKRFARLQRNLKNVGAQLSSMTSSITAPLAAVAASVGMSMTSIARTYMDAGGNIDDVSTRIGVSIDSLQRLRYAAQISGTSVQTLDSGITKFSQNLASAASGKNASLAELMQRLGISMRDASGNIRSAAEVLPEFADAIARNTNSALRARMAVAAFGNAGIELIPMLQDGSEGLKALTDRASELGVVMSEKDVKAAASLGRHFNEMNMSLGALSNSLGAKLAPMLERVFDRVTNLVAANREAFSEKFGKVAENFARTLETIDFEGFINGLLTVADLALRAFNAIGGFSTVITGLAVVMGGKAVMSVVSFVGSLITLGKSLSALIVSAKAVGMAMASSLGPVGLVIGGIAAAASLVVANWDSIWPAIKDGATGLVEFVSDALDICVKKFGAVVGAVFDVWKSLFTGDFVGVISGFDELVVATLGLLPGQFGEICQEIYQKFKDSFVQIGHFIRSFFTNFKWSDLLPDWISKFGSADQSKSSVLETENFASMPVGSAGTMTGSMRIGVYGYGGADPQIESLSSSDNLTIEGNVGRSERSFSW